MPNISNHTLRISLNTGLIVVYSDLFPVSNIFQVKYCLQNPVYPQKWLKYYRKDLKSSPNIQKTTKKQVIALEKYSIHLLFRMFSWQNRSFSNLIQQP